MLPRLIAEFIGSFFLVFSIALGEHAWVVGVTFVPLYYLLQPVSGAHFNPAVSFLFTLARKMSWEECFFYFLGQTGGAFVSASVVYFLIGRAFHPMPGPNFAFYHTYLAEIIFAFLLLILYLLTSTSKDLQKHPLKGLFLGFVLISSAYCAGTLVNPAIATGTTLFSAIKVGASLKHLWIYWIGPLTASILVLILYPFFYKKQSS